MSRIDMTTALPADFTITAHTGCMDTPANSMESLLTGLQNADIVEVDISKRDGIPVLFHGFTPPSDAVPLSEAFAVLAQYPGKRMNLDLKVFSCCAEVQALAVRSGVLDRVFFTGVYQSQVNRVRTDAPQIPYYLNCNILPLLKYSRLYIGKVVKAVRRCGAIGINCSHQNVTKQLVNTFFANGLQVSLWTARNEEQIKKILRLAPSNITTTLPDKAKALLETNGGAHG